MDIARHWRLRGQRYGLTGTVCTNCGKTFFVPRPICDVCNEPAAEPYAFENRRIRRSEQLSVQEPAQR
jgi:hypothetical protein